MARGCRLDREDDHRRWELYNLDEDFSENQDLAAKHPKKLEELKQLFDEEARCRSSSATTAAAVARAAKRS